MTKLTVENNVNMKIATINTRAREREINKKTTLKREENDTNMKNDNSESFASEMSACRLISWEKSSKSKRVFSFFKISI